jgi:hypothetical protein
MFESKILKVFAPRLHSLPVCDTVLPSKYTKRCRKTVILMPPREQLQISEFHFFRTLLDKSCPYLVFTSTSIASEIVFSGPNRLFY